MPSVWEHPEWIALLAAVRAAPPDDLPRLVAADWLDEHGETERAEFIRVQCRLARPPWNSKDMIREGQLWRVLREQFRSSLGRHWTVHSSQVRPCVEEDTLPSAIIHRGFVSEVRCNTLVDWNGEVCMRCDGTKQTAAGDGWRAVCYPCRGTGWSDGFGRTITVAHPVSKVIVTDVTIHPARFSGSNDGMIECPEADAEGWMVPHAAWHAVVPPGSPERWKNLFPTHPLAVKAFSDAMIAACKPKSVEVPA